jgi:hypothetical protein
MMRSLVLLLCLVIAVCVVQSSQGAYVFQEEFNGAFTNSWSPAYVPLGNPGWPTISYQGAPTGEFVTHDGAQVYRMSTYQTYWQRRGITSDQTLNTGAIQYVEARVNTLTQGSNNVLDDLLELWLVNATDASKYVLIGLSAPNYGNSRSEMVGSSRDGVWQPGWAQWAAEGVSFDNNTWYRLRISQLPSDAFQVSLWNDSLTNELRHWDLSVTAADLGPQVRIGISQAVGLATGYNESAVDYVRVEGISTPEPSTLALLGVAALGLLAYAWRRRASA